MMVEKFRTSRNDPKVIKGPFLRVSLDGSGCGLPHCNCSPKYFLSVSDGETGLKVELTEAEAAAILGGEPVTITRDELEGVTT